MRLSLIPAAAALALLAGCNQAADDDATGNSAANSGPVLPITDDEAAAGNAATVALPTQPVAPEQAAALMKQRHEDYEKIGDAMKVVSRQLKSDSPDLAAVRANAGIIASLAPRIPSWFPPGTGPEAGKTEAKAEIWRKSDDFVAKSKAFTAAALAFNSAAQGSDLAAIRAAHASMGKTCKACHDLYREEH